MTVESPFFLDTNMLVYAYDISEGQKHSHAQQMLHECIEGKRVFVVSNQVLAEFGRIALFKIQNPLSLEKVQEIVGSIMQLPSFIKINYSCQTFSTSLYDRKNHTSANYWDMLIGQTMKENGITVIYTENMKDFEKMDGIVPVNPFK